MTEVQVAETEVLTLQLHGALRTVTNLIENGTYTLQGSAFAPIANELEVVRKFAKALEDGQLLVAAPATDDQMELFDVGSI